MKRKSLLVLFSLLFQTALIFGQSPFKYNLAPSYDSKLISEMLRTAARNYENVPIYNSQEKANFNSQAVNCDDPNLIFAPTAAPCNGISVTSINFLSTSRSIVSGTDNTVGVVYKYANAGTAPDGTVVDAYVTVTSYSNNQDANQTNFRAADLVGDETTGAGYDRNLQPNLNQESGTFLNTGPWNAQITYQINFYRTGTLTPIRLTVAATSIDNDGATNTCNGLRETVTYGGVSNQILINTPANTTQVVTGNSVTPNSNTNQPGIGIGSNYASAALFVNVSQFNWSYSFATNPGNNCTQGTSSVDRLGSLNLTCQITFDRNFASVVLSGNVYNDTNGLQGTPANTVDGTGTNAGGLFANLVDTNGFVVSSVAVAANGTYSFPTAVNGSYTIQISTNQGIESSTAPAIALPAGWVNTGENLGATAGNDGTVNGTLAVTVAGAAVTNANFGIEQRPTANSNTAASQVNPGGTTNATVPSTVFSGTDPVTNTVSSIRITALPANATSITINGTLYGAGGTAFPAGGVITATNAAGNPTQPILVDPVDGAVTVAISYVAIDAAGVESLSPATASVPFTTVSLSGTVFNDANGLNGTPANTVDGTGTNINGTLFANLVNGAGNVVQSVAVQSNGTYSFAGLNGGSYTVQISTNSGTPGNTAPARVLPAAWAFTGENLGAGAGSDGTPDGSLAVTISTGNVANANFGIEERPTAVSRTAANNANIGGVNFTQVPPTTFSATDVSPGTVSSIRITAFPSNATSIRVGTTAYYPNAGSVPGTCPTTTCAVFPPTGITIATNGAGNPNQSIFVDPIDGPVLVGIPYVAIDNAGVESASPATATVPFTVGATGASVEISGSLFFGGNPLRNVLVSIFDPSINSTVFVRTNDNGRYTFEREVGKTYVIVPMSSKYQFNPANKVINLTTNVQDADFSSSAKNYHPKNDFDGDGKSDITVFRPENGVWYILASSDNVMRVSSFGQNGDVPVAGDFDGDGKSDVAVFRPENGVWYIQNSSDGAFRAEAFGLGNDKLVPGDYDGDGKTDIAVYRSGYWYILKSSNGAFKAAQFGTNEDIPVAQDFDGDGKSDLMVYRPSNSTWYMTGSINGSFSASAFGIATDIPMVGDYDGDGRADIAQFRNGNWYVLNSATGFESIKLGSGKTQSIVGDYDGDGRADTAVFNDGNWSIRSSDSGFVTETQFGLQTDILVK